MSDSEAGHQAIRPSNPANKTLPILMLTAECEMSLVKRAKLAGAVGWIVKPFDPNQLVQTVSKLTGESPDYGP